MFVELAIVAVILLAGNIAFRHFEPQLPWWRRVLKSLLILGCTALVSYQFGRAGVLAGGALALVAFLYVHAYWLPKHGVNGWTAEPRARYHQLRGWPPPR
ncbi:MAG: hypothetical protein NTZ56_24320 [Acidobacteria bacterium]|nr:hypothetical protein [Acidobacteriota bacterium]